LNEYLNEDKGAYMDTTSPPMLDSDGVTILRPLRGRTENGTYYDGMQRIVPGDLSYDELLPLAHANPAPAPPPNEGIVDPETLAMLGEDTEFEELE
jgi:hypothetical protein